MAKENKVHDVVELYRDYTFIKFYNAFLSNFKEAIDFEKGLKSCLNKINNNAKISKEQNKLIILDYFMMNMNKYYDLTDFDNTLTRIILDEVASAYASKHLSFALVSSTSAQNFKASVEYINKMNNSDFANETDSENLIETNACVSETEK